MITKKQYIYGKAEDILVQEILDRAASSSVAVVLTALESKDRIIAVRKEFADRFERADMQAVAACYLSPTWGSGTIVIQRTDMGVYFAIHLAAVNSNAQNLRGWRVLRARNMKTGKLRKSIQAARDYRRCLIIKAVEM